MVITVITIISMLLMIAVVIGVHEFGHYIAMRRCGVKVVEFTIGFGPTLFERKLKDGTMFRLKPIVLGGYARPVEGGENSMQTATRWQKSFIYVNGMVMNVLLAMVIMIVRNIIDQTTFSFLIPVFDWTPWWVSSIVSGMLEPIIYWLGTPVILVSFLTQPAQLMHGMAGPVGIATMGAEAVGQPTILQGLYGWFKFTGLISAAIAGFNMIPVEPLDGGKMVSLVIEKFLGEKVVMVYRVVGLVLFLGIVIMAFTADGLRIFGG